MCLSFCCFYQPSVQATLCEAIHRGCLLVERKGDGRGLRRTKQKEKASQLKSQSYIFLQICLFYQDVMWEVYSSNRLMNEFKKNLIPSDLTQLMFISCWQNYNMQVSWGIGAENSTVIQAARTPQPGDSILWDRAHFCLHSVDQNPHTQLRIQLVHIFRKKKG